MNRPSLNFIRVAPDSWTLEESETGKAFVPVGCNYYDARTGWPPQLWKRYDRRAVRRDFRLMEDLGLNAIRVWLQWSAFMPSAGKLDPRSLDQLHELLSFASSSGVRVNLTGPEFWEGIPSWLPPELLGGYRHFVSPVYQEAHALFWELFAAIIADEPTVYGFDLVNEPFMPWDGEEMKNLWTGWVMERYGSGAAVRRAWGAPPFPDRRNRNIPIPPNCREPGSRRLIDYQMFREDLAFRWIEKTVRAIRRVDRRHLITVGMHQSGSPLEEIIPSRYTAFNPHRLRECLDYISLHWYPFGNPLTAAVQPFDLPENAGRSLSMFLANCRYHYTGKPLIMEEFGYYGGGAPQFWGGVLPFRSEEEQDGFSQHWIHASMGSAGGWLNWPLQDTAGSTDTSLFGGLRSAGGRLKPWGMSFSNIARRWSGKRLHRRPGSVKIRTSHEDLLTDWAVCDRINRRSEKLSRDGVLWDFVRAGNTGGE